MSQRERERVVSGRGREREEEEEDVGDVLDRIHFKNGKLKFQQLVCSVQPRSVHGLLHTQLPIMYCYIKHPYLVDHCVCVCVFFARCRHRHREYRGGQHGPGRRLGCNDLAPIGRNRGHIHCRSCRRFVDWCVRASLASV